MAAVTMPDGTVVDMPDQIDPALGARLRAFQQRATVGVPGSIASANQNLPKTPAADSRAGEVPGEEQIPGFSDIRDAVLAGIAPSNLLAAARNMLTALGNKTPQEMAGAGTHIPENAAAIANTVANPQQTAENVGSTLRNATGTQFGTNVIAPTIVGLGAGKVAGGALSAITPSAEEAANATLGLNAGREGPLRNFAAGAGGEEARSALSTSNVNAATRVAGNQSGVPANVKVTPTSLDAAKVQPGNLLNAAAETVPTGPLHPEVVADLNAAGNAPGRITKGTPNANAYIQDALSRLTDPNAQFTGPQLRAEATGMRADGNAGIDSADPDIRQRAQFQRAAAAAIDKQTELTMPANGPFSVDQVKLARQTLAQNYTVGDLLKGDYLDLPGLGRLHQNNPGLLTGDLRSLGQFAVDHPEVSSLPSNPNRFAPPGFATGLGKAVGAEGGDVGSRVSNIFGAPTIAKKILGHDPEGAMAAASARPVTGLGGEFAPQPGMRGPTSQTPIGPAPSRQPPLPLAPGQGQTPGITMQPAPGTAFEPHQRELGLDPTQALPTNGIVSAPITQRLGDIIPGQRGAVGAPTDISGLRGVMNNPRTYGGSAANAASKAVTDKVAFNAYDEWQAGHDVNDVLDRYAQQGYPRDILERELKVLKGLTDQPRTYGGSLGNQFP